MDGSVKGSKQPSLPIRTNVWRISLSKPIQQCLLIALVAIGVATVGTANNFRSHEVAEVSPHVMALQLVHETQQEKIREVDTQSWHTDTIRRDWSAQRPEAREGVDNTHLFIVSYRIGEHEACAWLVDTATRKVLTIEREDEAEL